MLMQVTLSKCSRVNNKDMKEGVGLVDKKGFSRKVRGIREAIKEA